MNWIKPTYFSLVLNLFFFLSAKVLEFGSYVIKIYYKIQFKLIIFIGSNLFSFNSLIENVLLANLSMTNVKCRNICLCEHNSNDRDIVGQFTCIIVLLSFLIFGRSGRWVGVHCYFCSFRMFFLPFWVA